MSNSSITAFLYRQRWNAERFGLTPGKLKYRWLDSGAPRIACISIPKAGTHLIERALCRYPSLYRPLYKTFDEANTDARRFRAIVGGLRPGQVIFCHLFYSAELEGLLRDNGVKSVLMVRDLRDIVISEANYLSSTTGHLYHRAFDGLNSQKEKLVKSMQGCEANGLPSMATLFDGFEGWLSSDAIVVRFEDLVGPAGGGDAASQINALRHMYASLGIECSRDRLEQISSGIFSSVSPTFNRGQVAQWRSVFDDDLKHKFKELTGDAIIRYGYETTSAW